MAREIKFWSPPSGKPLVIKSFGQVVFEHVYGPINKKTLEFECSKLSCVVCTMIADEKYSRLERDRWADDGGRV